MCKGSQSLGALCGRSASWCLDCGPWRPSDYRRDTSYIIPRKTPHKGQLESLDVHKVLTMNLPGSGVRVSNKSQVYSYWSSVHYIRQCLLQNTTETNKPGFHHMWMTQRETSKDDTISLRQSSRMSKLEVSVGFDTSGRKGAESLCREAQSSPEKNGWLLKSLRPFLPRRTSLSQTRPVMKDRTLSEISAPGGKSKYSYRQKKRRKVFGLILLATPKYCT